MNMTERPQNILIHDWCGHPFTFDLSRELAARGYTVHHLYTLASAGPKARVSTDSAHLIIHHVDFAPIQKSRFLIRWFQDRAYGARVARIIRQVRPHLVMSANTPLETQRKIADACRGMGITFIFWQQDIISIAARSILSKKNRLLGAIVGRYFQRLEKQLLRQSDRIIVIADEFREIISAWGLPQDKIKVIPNWAPIADIPQLPRKNSFSAMHNLQDKFVLLYSGTMGMKHNPHMIIRLAEHFAHDPDFKLVVATDGVGGKVLAAEKKKLGLPNLLLLPLQPFEIFPQVLATADILLVLLEEDAGRFSVPSKVWAGYCAGKPTILAAPRTNLAARLTRRIDAGVVVPPDDFNSVVAAIADLARHPKKRAAMGQKARAYAEKTFPIQHIASEFEDVFQAGHWTAN